MLKLLVGASGFVAGLVLSGFVFAVSMGGINVVTALGEPLRAEIELEAASKAEADSVSARLATLMPPMLTAKIKPDKTIPATNPNAPMSNFSTQPPLRNLKFM